MGLFDFLFGKKKDNEVSHYAFVSDDKGKGITHEEAKNLQEELMINLQVGEKSYAINIAATLMTKKAYDEAIEAYTKIAEHFPEEKGVALGQIGAAYFFKGEYPKAIECYVSARENGEHAGMMDDNIWEACEVLHSQSGDKKWAKKYLELCPNGSYKKKAEKLLQ